MKTTLLAAAFLTFWSLTAEAKGYHHRHHHYAHSSHHYSRHLGHYLSSYWHRKYHRHLARHYRHRDKVPLAARSGSFQLTRVRLPDGQITVVNALYADRFIGFFRELFDREWKLPEIVCYAAHGHMPLPWGRHPAGEACDVGQQSRNVAWRVMYHITDLAHRWGLTDGCEWRGNPDCGHIQINRAVAVVPAVVPHMIAARRPRTYQVAGAWPL